MDDYSNTFGHHTNNLASQRLQYYQGCVVVEFQHLRFENDVAVGSRFLDKQNISRIIKIFKIEGCGNLEPEHRIAALIDEETLSKALSLSGLSRDSILDPTTQPLLSLEDGTHLTCIYGQHRLIAAESFGETRWLVDLYMNLIPEESLTQLRQESAKSLDLTDGEIYRVLRSYQISNNIALERKWRAKLKSEGRRQDIRRLQRHGELLEILDKLLPYIGLWKPLKTTQIERMLGLKCPELLKNYLSCVHETWSHVFNAEAGLFVDPTSVQLIEGLMPQTSLNDRRRIAHLVDKREIFGMITGAQERESMRERLLSLPGRIITLNTMAQDTLFLEKPAKALRCLCPRFTGSFRNAMRHRWTTMGTQRELEIQTSEHKFSAVSHSKDSFSICLLQLWLFAFRHFVPHQMRTKKNKNYFGWSTEGYSLRKLSDLAHRLGFQSDQIGELLSENLHQRAAKGFVESLCDEDFYTVDPRRINSLSVNIQKILRHLPTKSEESHPTAEFATDSPEREAKNRFNSPAQEQYEEIRKHFFIGHIFGPEQEAAQYPTPLGVIREMLCCFFGHKYKIMLPIHPEMRTEASTEQTSHTRQNSLIEQSLHEHDGDQVTVIDHALASETIVNEQDLGLDMYREETMEKSVDADHEMDDQSSSRYSRSPGTPPRAEYYPSEPVEIEPYPSGTPDPPPPIAPGFEEASCIQPMEKENILSVRRRVPEILNIWFQSRREVIVLFLFESRIYYKFSETSIFNLRSTLQSLSREHIFITINEFGIGTPDINKTYEEVVKEHLLLVGKRDNPAQGKDEIGLISRDKLQDYIIKYDIQTGKRKGDLQEEGSRKRGPGAVSGS